MSPSAERQLKDLGIKLPCPPTPLGAYVEVVQSGNLLFLSGTLPVEHGVPKFLGRIGAEISGKSHMSWSVRRQSSTRDAESNMIAKAPRRAMTIHAVDA
jgi:hypothetical protein